MDVQKMQKELEHLLAEVHWIQQKLKNLPEENISCERDKQYIRWYLRETKLSATLTREISQ